MHSARTSNNPLPESRDRERLQAYPTTPVPQQRTGESRPRGHTRENSLPSAIDLIREVDRYTTHKPWENHVIFAPRPSVQITEPSRPDRRDVCECNYGKGCLLHGSTQDPLNLLQRNGSEPFPGVSSSCERSEQSPLFDSNGRPLSGSHGPYRSPSNNIPRDHFPSQASSQGCFQINAPTESASGLQFIHYHGPPSSSGQGHARRGNSKSSSVQQQHPQNPPPPRREFQNQSYDILQFSNSPVPFIYEPNKLSVSLPHHSSPERIRKEPKAKKNCRLCVHDMYCGIRASVDAYRRNEPDLLENCIDQHHAGKKLVYPQYMAIPSGARVIDFSVAGKQCRGLGFSQVLFNGGQCRELFASVTGAIAPGQQTMRIVMEWEGYSLQEGLLIVQCLHEGIDKHALAFAVMDFYVQCFKDSSSGQSMSANQCIRSLRLLSLWSVDQVVWHAQVAQVQG
ncbi:hypothetical protein HGRIS_000994 [Hohenbuehelia grisea]|uniref:Uncharacterized protein n=1 Tax=Hohenbuehelia grisea TaxID=104357 RepID=A0ABR3IQF9_9AGAR